ncbi:uncharacterized protein [Dysidea avara]|uniref:uncharacterized protein n=1 Tax=Dysidea avara TaxID=196820 RepID=UPI00331652BE
MRWVGFSLAIAATWLVGYLQLTIWLLLLLLPLLLWVMTHHMNPSHTPNRPPPPAKKPLLPTESCHWLNHLIKEWIVTRSPYLLPWIKDHVDDVLGRCLPTGVGEMELISLDLTDCVPSLDEISVLKCATPQPAGSHGDVNQSNVLINCKLSLDTGEECVELRARMGGRSCGCDVTLMIDDFHLCGFTQLLISFDHRMSHPSVSMVTVAFKEKPELWFNLRILKGLQITHIPLLHYWLYHYISECLTDLLVDPGQATIRLNKKCPIDNLFVSCSGVLTINVMATISPSQSATPITGRHMITTSVGEQKRKCDIPINDQQWKSSVSFFINNNSTNDMLRLKIKRTGLLNTTTLAVHTLDLHTLGLLGQQTVQDQTSKCYTTTLRNNYYTLVVTLTHTVLPSVCLSSPVVIEKSPQQVAGILTICIHSVEMVEATGSCDPYCVVTVDGREVLVTDHQSDCSIAHWDKLVEVMTSDYTRPITFELLHWSGHFPSYNLIGYNKLSLTKETQLLQHKLELCSHGNGEIMGTMTVSVIFRPVDTLRHLVAPCGVGIVDDNVSLSSYDSRGSVMKKNSYCSIKKTSYRKGYKISGTNDKGILEFSIIKGRNLVPMDTDGLSNPYIVVKYGMEVMYRSKVFRHTLNPDWRETVSLTAPNLDEIITVTCWDKDQLSDDFMGSVQISRDDFMKFKSGPKWLPLQLVNSGELLLSVKELIPIGVQDYSEESITVERDSVDGDSLAGQLEIRSYSDDELLNSRRSSLHPVSTNVSLTANNSPSFSPELDEVVDVPTAPRYSSTKRDIEHALKNSPLPGRSNSQRKQSGQASLVYGLSGMIVKVEGLKGDLSNIELYVKIRLNCNMITPHNRYSRGTTVHKTRSIKGQSSPQWNEPFSLQDEVVVFNNSLLTVDLKSGSKVNIGTHTITLEKFFEGSMKESKWLDIGNDARLHLELSRQPVPATGRHTFFRSTPRRSASLRVKKLTKTYKI